ncbi:Tripeptidyl-peptidase 1 [Diplonema papillatum]|nr:Tripeptidyl-peptidase 1 [Diplonema papillatum]
MRAWCVVGLVAVASAAQVQVHPGTEVPKGWRRTDDTPSNGTVFYNVGIAMKRSNAARLVKMLEEVSQPGGPQYQNYPTYEEMGELVRPSAENTAVVKKWLAKHGVTDVQDHPHGDYFRFSATAGQLEAMAGGKFSTYVHTTGRILHRITSGVHVDQEVAAAIDTFTGFHTFPFMPAVAVAAPPGPVKTCSPYLPPCYVTPALLREVYNITNVTKSGKTNVQGMVQMGGSSIETSQLKSFCSVYAPTTVCTVEKYIGYNNDADPVQESMLDSEYISTVSNQSLYVYSAGVNVPFCSGLLDLAANVTSESVHPYTVTINYGWPALAGLCDNASQTRFEQDVIKMSNMGVTVIASSGAQGSGFDVNQGILNPSYPATLPHVLSVGGTRLTNGTYGLEQGSTAFLSGGGFSWNNSVPSYQASAVAAYLSSVTLPTAPFAANGRGTPDISALGEDYTVRIWGYQDFSTTGTSASADAVAGMIALLNEACLGVGGKTLGFVNPLFYLNPDKFRDVTVGSNAIENQGWNATKGWDAVTGLGSPNFDQLLKVVVSECEKVAKRNN